MRCGKFELFIGGHMERAADKRRLSIFNFKQENHKENSILAGKILLFLFFSFLFFNHVEPQYESSFNASLIDKTERLKSIEGAKIVLLGNSNLVFGIDSAMIEQELGIPVVNMGLHGGLGNAFHERMAEFNIQKGDIYILCHSSYADDDSIDNAELAWITIENHFELWKLLRWKDFYKMAQALPVYLRKTIDIHSAVSGNGDAGDIYSRSAFNEYGDCGIEREGSIYTELEWISAPSVNSIAVERINSLSGRLKSRGATLLVAGFPIGMGEKTDDKEKFVDFQTDLEEMLECPVISDCTDYMYDYSCFYDYNYLHLNSGGAKLRTRQLISDIEGWLAEDGK